MRARQAGAAGLLIALCAVLSAAAPAPAVLVAPVQLRDVAPAYQFIGRVTAIQSVQIVARVTAFIEAEPASQGSEVKAGEVLFKLQPTQYQAAVQAAQAKLDAANAAVRQAQVAYDRAAQLNRQGVESQANLDQATATLAQDQANVLGAQAAVAQAGLDLSYTMILSPIDGRMGAITLTKGNLVTPTTPPLATVNQMDPIRVVFSISDRVLVDVEQKTGSTASEIAARVVVGLTLPDGSAYKQSGKISFLDNQVDPQTGTVSVYADFPNPDRLLLPGAFVSTDVRSAKAEEHPMVPVAAVQTDQNGSYVLIVGSDAKVRQQPVELGRQIAQDFIVNKGLSAGDRVIVEGIQKVRPGEVVNAQPAPAPIASAAIAAAAKSGN
ncbi:MAG: efflux RND transporter periplasmic adaptor subunit [Acetobacteraceae bacterium]